MIPLPQVFTARQVANITGVPYSKLDFWATSGLIQPSVSKASGSGSRRLYDRQDLVRIRLVGNLRKSGISGKALRKIILHLPCSIFDGSFAVETLGKDVVLKRGGNEIISALSKPGQMYFSLTEDVSEALSHVTQQIELLQNAQASAAPPRKQPGAVQKKPPKKKARRLA